MEETSTYSLPEGKVLALKILNANGKSAHNDFQYPGVGRTVSAPDWRPNFDCGHGLHGYLWGHGDIQVSLYKPGKVQLYQVHEVNLYVALNGKIKYPSALVVAEFDAIIDALNFIEYHTPEKFKNADDKVVEVIETTNYYKCIQESERPAIQIGKRNAIQVSTEDMSMQNALYNSIQVTRRSSYQNAGFTSVQIGDDNVKQVTLSSSIQRAQCSAVQLGGDNCIQDSNHNSIQTAGDNSIQRSGSKSRISAGVESIQYAGINSMCKAGVDSQIFIKYQDKNGFTKFSHGFVDGNKIKADTWYKVEEKTGKFYEVDYEGNRIPSLLSILKTRLLSRLANLKNLRW